MDVMEKTESEKRLIDASAFLKDILTGGIGKPIIEYSASDIGYMIRKRPTADPVEVVRCRECKHYEIHKPKVLENCERNGYMIPMKPDDFCSYGERKEGAN